MDSTTVIAKPAEPLMKRKKKRKDYKLLLLTLPFILYIVVFNYIPLGGWILAFFDYEPGFKLSQLGQMEFVGLDIFRQIINDYKYLAPILLNTICMSGLMLLNAPAAIVLAIFVNEIRSDKLKKIVQTTITLPNFISMIIVYSLFFSMFSYYGAVNEILMNTGLIKEPLNVLGNSDIAWEFQLFINLWKHCGWNTIIYLGAIAGIDQELYDAVEIDGGGRFRRIWHITVPGILPTFLVIFLLNISNILNNNSLWEQVFVFMNPMVQEKLEILGYYIYRMGIVSQNYSYATAMGIMNSIISISLLFLANGLAKKIRGNSII